MSTLSAGRSTHISTHSSPFTRAVEIHVCIYILYWCWHHSLYCKILYWSTNDGNCRFVFSTCPETKIVSYTYRLPAFSPINLRLLRTNMYQCISVHAHRTRTHTCQSFRIYYEKPLHRICMIYAYCELHTAHALYVTFRSWRAQTVELSVWCVQIIAPDSETYMQTVPTHKIPKCDNCKLFARVKLDNFPERPPIQNKRHCINGMIIFPVVCVCVCLR